VQISEHRRLPSAGADGSFRILPYADRRSIAEDQSR
jgi:hypothetical protein